MKRTYLPADFKVTTWDSLKPYFDELLSRNISSSKELYTWYLNRSEFESAISEDLGWRYIKMTCDTTNEEIKNNFNFFVSELQPAMAPYSNQLDTKALEDPFLKDLKDTEGFDIVIKLLEKDKALYREENIELNSEIEQTAHEFGTISAAMTIVVDDKEITMQQAADYLLQTDRDKRAVVWKAIQDRRYQEKTTLDNLYTTLIGLRNTVSKNAGFENFRDYMFVAMGRFDYSPEDCFSFHEAIKGEVVPILNSLSQERKKALKLDALKPWDLSVNYFGDTPLKPFKDADDLTEKTIQCFSKLDAYTAECIATMKKMGHLDLMSRKGKAPGGYNYPLDESGVPFIFMNATQSLRDLVTMVHEGGHALHSFLTADLELNVFKHPTSEVAELASMSMELMSMEHWDIFFENEKDLARAKREHLESVLQTLPWVATIDLFQHKIYEKPDHTLAERETMWKESFYPFSGTTTDWSGLEKYRENAWQKQLHLFEVPFYYIEYGMAQLGAIAVWRNYKKDPQKGYALYKNALAQGYKKSIPEVYKAAGIKFDFSKEYIKELMDFVKSELSNLNL
ncbi:M3 family oligoendopeptidase [uncultured Cytophaga sp.]|uniref:M3 family oligoendopeptidase n=1 Tax=uncultured Cytophaga sp. TaxID=160238 RepID=UPI00262EF784|nr:M3 family oligoendopeptidase [uncultured Cytophaga sp.]